jgi:hypothetical protein
VDALARNVAKRAVDHALALKPILAGECHTFDYHGEVRFAASVIARVSVMARAVVDYIQSRGQEGVLQQGFDLLCERSAHWLTPGVFIGATYHH